MHLKGIRTITTLGLEKTQITDSGLEELKGVTGLAHVRVGDMHVTEAGIVELKRAFPKLTISK